MKPSYAELEKRVAELERQVSELKAGSSITHVHYYQPPMPIIGPQPYPAYVPPAWPPGTIICGSGHQQ